jgi:hypothetical protein
MNLNIVASIWCIIIGGLIIFIDGRGWCIACNGTLFTVVAVISILVGIGALATSRGKSVNAGG